jgi:hypothetical protein
MYIKGLSKVLECDISCHTFQGGGEDHHVSLMLSGCSHIWEFGQNKAIQPWLYMGTNLLMQQLEYHCQ